MLAIEAPADKANLYHVAECLISFPIFSINGLKNLYLAESSFIAGYFFAHEANAPSSVAAKLKNFKNEAPNWFPS